MITLKVELNGTNKNPYHTYGLSQNPFPQVASKETDAACMALQALGGDPIPDVDYIRAKLNPHFSEEFVELCCNRFVKGAIIRFSVRYGNAG